MVGHWSKAAGLYSEHFIGHQSLMSMTKTGGEGVKHTVDG